MENKKIKLLLVEDDKNFALVLKSYLEIHFMEVDLAYNGIEALKLLQTNNYSLCILDVVMSKMDGYELAKQIKIKYPDVKFVFLSSRNLKDDIVKGYELGAIDYLCKPFDSDILLLKINALLAQEKLNKASLDNKLELGKYSFNPAFRTLSFGNLCKKLTEKESKLLELLLLYKNSILSRDYAQTQIWGDDSYFVGRSMDVFISKLRKYLKDDPNISIENIRGEGFSLKVKQ